MAFSLYIVLPPSLSLIRRQYRFLFLSLLLSTESGNLQAYYTEFVVLSISQPKLNMTSLNLVDSYTRAKMLAVPLLNHSPTAHDNRTQNPSNRAHETLYPSVVDLNARDTA